jgi:hypothetical protein
MSVGEYMRKLKRSDDVHGQSSPDYQRLQTRIIIALIAVIAIIVAAIIPAGPENKPLICNVANASWSVCRPPTSTILQPTTAALWNNEVDSQRVWQDTGLHVEANTTIRIEVLDGKWTNFKGTGPYNRGEGTGYICGKVMPPNDCVEPIPMVSSDALIGRVGEQLFYIGQKVTIVSQQAGMLSLRINDGDTGLYDNDGSLKVTISILDE